MSDDAAKYEMLGRFMKDCIDMVQEAGLHEGSTSDAMVNAYLTQWEKQKRRILELEGDIRILKNIMQSREHHVLCSMRSRPVEECPLCQRLYQEQVSTDKAGYKCIEYCATTSQAIRKDIRDAAQSAWAILKPVSAE